MNYLPIRYQRPAFYTLKTTKMVRAMLAVVGILSLVSQASADEIDVWIGAGDGIYYLKLDTDKGTMSTPKLAENMKGAGFLAMHPNGKILYSTDRAENGAVTAIAIEPGRTIEANLEELKPQEKQLTEKFGAGHQKVKELRKAIQEWEDLRDGKSKKGIELQERGQYLKRINSLPTGDGGAACVAVDKTGKVLMSAHYGGGSVSTYLLKPDGRLDRHVETIEHGPGSGVVGKRQETAHPHWVGTSPDNRFLMVPDLGLDRVVVYELDAKTAQLKPHGKVVVPPGSGPRHMKFHTSGKYVYVLNELTLTVSVFEYDANNGEFKNIQLIETLPNDQKDKHLNSAAEIRVHPNGRFVYTSNRGHDSITVFSVDQKSGKLAFVEREHIRGSTPRNFNIDPSGNWLIAAGQRSNTLALFEIEQNSGALIFTRKVVNVPAPICVLFGSK